MIKLAILINNDIIEVKLDDTEAILSDNACLIRELEKLIHLLINRKFEGDFEVSPVEEE